MSKFVCCVVCDLYLNYIVFFFKECSTYISPHLEHTSHADRDAVTHSLYHKEKQVTYTPAHQVKCFLLEINKWGRDFLLDGCHP